jgi:hypothetical protein
MKTRLTIEFEADRELTTDEFLTLAGYLELQIAEPYNQEQEQEDWSGREIIIKREEANE